MVSTALSLIALASTYTGLVSALPRVDPAVHRTLRRQGTVNLFVTLKDGTETPLNALHEANFETRGEMIQAMVDRLQKHAASSQSEVAKILLQEAGQTETPLFTEVKSFWITNELYFKGASLELVEKLAALPSVSAITEEAIIRMQSVAVSAADSNVTTAASLEWGVAKIQAAAAWTKGFTGQGIVVGGIDSGVRATHESLRGNWRRSYGWFDAATKSPEPVDSDGHGTHTIATAVGANGVGVAPGATWIACRSCANELCSQEALLSCGQFMTCPTDPAGKNPDCTKAPHIVNNSWGGSGPNFFDKVLSAWTAAGIIPVFSNGNSGMSGCSTTDNPADSEKVIAVGATSNIDGLGVFSSKGPTKAKLIKPDISAPGVDVRSASHTSDSDFRAISGTSHAAPHVAGVIALMLSANKNLKFDQVRDILSTTAVRSPALRSSGYTCGGTPDAIYPNNQYGYGRVDALAATVKAAVSA